MSKTVRLDPEAGDSIAASIKWAQSLVGCVVGDRYRVEAVIAASESGAVYRAEHTGLHNRVALKVLDASASDRDVARFEREAMAGARIRHPNVLSPTDYGTLSDGGRYLAMEHVAGATLRQILRKGPMPVPRALRIMRQLAAALAAAHAEGVVHRNVEPRNIMLTGDAGDEVKLIGFGLAKVAARTEEEASAKGREDEDLTVRTHVLTATGIIQGTTAYLPPEAALGTAVVDARGDLYSAGVVFYEMLTGRRPFDEKEPASLFAAQRDREVPTISERAPGVAVPEEVETIVRKLLAPLRDERYATASAALEALAAEPSAVEPSRASPRTASAARRSLASQVTAPVIVMAVALFSVIAIGAWAVATHEPRKPPRSSRDDDDDRPAKRRSPGAYEEATGSAGPPSGSSSSSSSSFSSAPVATGAPSSPSALPPSSASAASTDWRSELTRAAKTENWIPAAKAIEALVDQDPEAFGDWRVIAAVASTAVALASAGGERADKLFDALATRLEERGLWLLFEIVRTKGGTKGSERATSILSDPSVVAREPPALVVAFHLVAAPCGEKSSFFAQAAKDGDSRAFTALKALKEMECPRRNAGPCCFRDNEQIDDAIETLRVKLGKPKEPR